MKTKKINAKHSRISREETIKQLNKDLAELMPESEPNIPIDLLPSGKVRIKDLTPAYLHPNKLQQQSTLRAGEYQLLGKHESSFGVLHNDESFWIPQENVESTVFNFAAGAKDKVENWLHEKLQPWLQKAAALRDKYNDNPYIRISGFSVDLTWPPGWSIEFEFRDGK